MTKETYIKMMEYWEKRPRLLKLLRILNKLSTIVVVVSYPLLLAYLWTLKTMELATAIIIPFNAFVILTVFRFYFNRKRPYEKFETSPAISKDKKGNSFPSRHVFSAFMIAFTVCYYAPWQWWGISLLMVGCFIAVIRVVSGIHFISDVLAGFLVATVASVFYL